MKTVHALTRIYDLLLRIIPVLEKFPRTQRFLLGDRIEKHLLQIMELLVQAAYTKNKRDFLINANLKLEILRYLTRLSKDLKYLSIKKYEFIAKALNETGKQLPVKKRDFFRRTIPACWKLKGVRLCLYAAVRGIIYMITAGVQSATTTTRVTGTTI